MTELSMEVEVHAVAGAYRIQARSEAGGECAADLRIDLGDRAIENHLRRLRIALLSSAAVTRRVAGRDERAAQDLGGLLFDSLFTGDVRTLFDTTRQQAAMAGNPMRLVLRLGPPELATLPWEFLYDDRRDDYVGLSMPLVRYPALMEPIRPLLVEPPLRVVGLSACPRTMDDIDAKMERVNLENAVRGLDRGGRLVLDWATGETWRDLLSVLDRGQWHVLHLVGHGEFDEGLGEGVFFLATEDGRSYPLRASRLAQIAALHPSLRLIVLNSCDSAAGSSDDAFSSTAATLLKRGVPAVLAMQFEISDRAAVEFTKSFYCGIAVGLPVDVAVRNARVHLSLAFPDSVEWGTPVLFLRQRNGQIFEVPAQRSAPEPAPARRTVASALPAPPPVTVRPSVRRRTFRISRALVVSAAAASLLVGTTITALRHLGGTGAMVTVPANVAWTLTGIALERGDRVRITATGEIHPQPGLRSGPDGVPDGVYAGLILVPSGNYGALVGRIGAGAPFGLGRDTEVRVSNEGELSLGVNDLDVGDSTGEFRTQISPQ